MVIGDFRRRRIDPPVFGMHDLESLRPAPHLAKTADAHAASEACLLLRREIKKTQRQKARAIADPAEHLPPAAERNLGEQNLALHCRPLAGEQLAERHHARSILVAQRQQKQQVLRGLHA